MSFLDSFSAALPQEIRLDDLKIFVPCQWWQDMPEKAAIAALRRCGRFDTHDYLARYPDVVLEGTDPVLHFVQHGIREHRHFNCLPEENVGRSRVRLAYEYFKQGNYEIALDLYETLAKEMGAKNFDVNISLCKKKLAFKTYNNEEQVYISLIIPNYNNEKYIGKCLESIVNQSLKNIEIIVIDDCSTDSSTSIIKKFAEKDERIKFIEYTNRRSQNQARKDAVSIASGKYIMFVDSDDYLNVDACKIAYNKINNKYDIVCFNTNIINANNINSQRLSSLNKFLNGQKENIYKGKDILEHCFIKYDLSFTIWNKIYSGKLCKKAFSIVENGYYPKAQDAYAFFIIASMAKNLYKIDDILYNYNFGIGISEVINDEKRLENFFSQGKILIPLAKYADNFNYRKYFESLKTRLLTDSVSKWFTQVEEKYSAFCFNLLVQHYGLINVITLLIDKYFYAQDELAEKIKNYKITSKVTQPQKIGIFYHRISYGGVQRVISILSHLLITRNYSITLFLEEKSEYDYKIHSNIDIVYITSSEYKREKIKLHIKDFYEAIQRHDIDIMLYQAGNSAALIWDILLFREMNIPVIVSIHECFSNNFINLRVRYGISKFAVLRLANRVICLSHYAELYFSSFGIKAIYIANPIPVKEAINTANTKNVVVIGRLDDKIKQIDECLKVLRELRKYDKNIKMYFVGDFNLKSSKDRFYQKIDEYSLKRNVCLTGWTDTPEKYIKNCSVLLSTSCSEGFSMAIGEAQSLGLPCVIYELPIAICDKNNSIITVKQGDYKSAAANIIRILANDSYRNKLSIISQKNIKRFSPELCIEKYISVINTCTDKYIQKEFDNSIFNTVIRSIINHTKIGIQNL